MKKVLLSVLAMLAFAGSGTAQNLPSYVPANGLVGWWPFNGNANDESGNGNNGTVNGATLTTDRFGENNNSYQFSSSNSNYITINSNPIQNGPSSVSGWFYATAPTGGPIFHIGSDNGTPNNCNGYFFGFGNSANPNGNTLLIDASCIGTYNTGWTANSNSWYHFTLIRDQNNLTAYINGNVVGTYNPSAINSPSTSIFFGSTYFTNSVFFNGKIDDIAIYNRALTQQEITNLYQGANTTSNCLSLPSNLQQGLVGYWPFCGNANDESGNGNNGTVNGATLTTDRFGNAGKAYGFDGVDDIINTNYSGVNGRKSRTVSFWYNPASLQTENSKTMFGYGETISGDQCGKRFDCTLFQNASPSIDLAYSYVTYNYSNSIGNWHHYIVTYDSTFGTSPTNIKMYIDGIIQTNILSSSLTCEINTGDVVPVSFGGPYLVTTGHNFHGSLDDIAIWNRALSQQEITQLYNQGICQLSITVTDTLLIHTGITSYNPVAYQNTLKVWPNPGNQDITLDAGNLSLMQGWKIKISNSLGQEVYPATLISQQQQVLDMSTWGGNGLYFLHLINPQGHITEVKKIVLAP